MWPPRCSLIVAIGIAVSWVPLAFIAELDRDTDGVISVAVARATARFEIPAPGHVAPLEMTTP
jgi:hypothetical protein